MNNISIAVLIIASISFFTGFNSLLIYFKRKSSFKNLLFSSTCFSITIYNIFTIALFNSTSVAEGILWQRLQFVGMSFFLISITWFIYNFIPYFSKKIFGLISLILLVFATLGLSVYNEYTLSINNPMILNFNLTSWFHITYYKASPGIIFISLYVCSLIITFFLLFLIIRYFLLSKDKSSTAIIFSLIICAFAIMNDLFIYLGFLKFIYVLEYSFFIIILSIAYSLMNKHVAKYNEIEELNLQMEDKINHRTIELFFSEIAIKIYNEIHKNSLESSRMNSELLEDFFKNGKESSIKNLSHDISIISNFDQLLKIILEKSMKISNAECGYIFLKNENDELVLKKFKTVHEIVTSSFSKSIVDKVFREEKPVIIENDLENSERDAHIICLPLLAKELNVGVCYFECILEKKDIIFATNILLHFLSSITKAIENASIFEKNTINSETEKIKFISPSIEEKLKKIISFLKKYYKFEISQEELAASINIHPNTLDKNFEIYTGKKINEYITELRIYDVAEMIASSDKSIIELAFAAGFDSLKNFNRAFQKVMRINPSKYRELKSTKG